MTRQHHGVLSLGLIFLAVAVGVFSIMQSSALWAVIYLGLSISSSVLIVYSFCSKCPCREHSCGHVLPGKLTKLLPERAGAGYSIIDLAGVVIPLLFIIIVPQFWIWGNIPWLFSFWALLIIAVADIIAKVCTGCDNKYCPANGKINQRNF